LAQKDPRVAGELEVIIADTDVLIDHFAGFQPITSRISAYAQAQQLQTTVINCFELLSGAEENKRGAEVRRFLAAIPVLPLDHKAAEQAAIIRRELERTGQSIGMGDSLIAGIALTHGFPLFTRNRKHFEQVPGLQLVGWEHNQ
jgi:tRNA(fMet)-specific endonuclease VapC